MSASSTPCPRNAQVPCHLPDARPACSPAETLSGQTPENSANDTAPDLPPTPSLKKNSAHPSCTATTSPPARECLAPSSLPPPAETPLHIPDNAIVSWPSSRH